jgi:hypothetical protein
VPFVTWEGQDTYLAKLVECVDRQVPLAVPKSRDAGASWGAIYVADWLWRFHQYFHTGLSSRVGDLVDSKSPDSLFWKLRFVQKWLPNVAVAQGVEPKTHDTEMHLQNPETNSIVSGHPTTKDIGVAGRCGLFVFDEYARVPNARVGPGQHEGHGRGPGVHQHPHHARDGLPPALRGRGGQHVRAPLDAAPGEAAGPVPIPPRPGAAVRRRDPGQDLRLPGGLPVRAGRHPLGRPVPGPAVALVRPAVPRAVAGGRTHQFGHRRCGLHVAVLRRHHDPPAGPGPRPGSRVGRGRDDRRGRHGEAGAARDGPAEAVGRPQPHRPVPPQPVRDRDGRGGRDRGDPLVPGRSWTPFAG